ncbi:MAG: hypothetical protein J6A56_02730, partial [Clostridia bacterium]|nr:hypothetical protein [Clostridia bacterium]
ASLYDFVDDVLRTSCNIDGCVKMSLQANIFTYGIINAVSLALQVFTTLSMMYCVHPAILTAA